MTTKDITLIANFAEKHELGAEQIFDLLAIGAAHMMELTLHQNRIEMHKDFCNMYYDIHDITTKLREETGHGQSRF